MENTEVLTKIFENKNNTVTLNLGDYESIKAVFDENKSLKEENAKLKDKVENVYRVFVKAKFPPELVKDIEDGNVEVESAEMHDSAFDPLTTKKVLVIKSHRLYQ